MEYYEKKKEMSSEIYGDISVYKHVSGAEIVVVKNFDENLVFSMSFKTPPNDDNGGFHVLEHCVLCGSEKYKIKDPFNYLAKTMRYTYLNAMTFHDKTVYPVASTNETDFKNMIDVYIDAIANPLIVKKKEIYMQEGVYIKYNLSEDNSFDNEYSGIVYNEMKSMYSDELYFMTRKLHKVLFNSHYQFDSAGNPEKIINLRYADVLSLYDEYYKWDNAVIYLYGNVDVQDYLEYIHENYLSININKNDEILNFNKLCDSKYNTSHGKEKNDLVNPNREKIQTNYLIGIVCPCENTCENILLLEIFHYYFVEMDNSFLKTAMKKMENIPVISGEIDYDIKNPLYKIFVQNTNLSLNEIEKILYDMLNEISFDHDKLEQILDIIEFKYMENTNPNRPKGLQIYFKLIANIDNIDFSWFHISNMMKELKVKVLGTACFEEFVQNIKKNATIGFVNNIKENRENNVQNSWNDEKIIINNEIENLSLINYQNEKETSNLKLAFYDVDEIDRELRFTNMRKLENLHFVSVDTSGIVYVNCYFDMGLVNQEYYDLLRIFIEFAIYENSYHGGDISFDKEKISVEYAGYKNIKTGKISIKLLVRKKMLYVNIEKSLRVLNEFLLGVIFLKIKNISSLKEICRRIYSGDCMKLIQNSNIYSKMKINSETDLAEQIREKIYGVSSIKFMRNIVNGSDVHCLDIIEKFNKISNEIFYKGGCEVFCIGEKDKEEEILKSSKLFYQEFETNIDAKIKNKTSTVFIKGEAVDEAIIINSEVNSNAILVNFENEYLLEGVRDILTHLLDESYLYNEVRLKLSAYECKSWFVDSSTLILTSNRDPNIIETYRAYDRVFQNIKKHKFNKEELENLIKAGVWKNEKPLIPYQKGLQVIEMYYKGISSNDLQMKKNEILNICESDIENIISSLNENIVSKRICSAGNCYKIKKNGDIFNNIVTIM